MEELIKRLEDFVQVKDDLVDFIFNLADSDRITKSEAINILTNFRLLSIGYWCDDGPQSVLDQITDNDPDRLRIYYYNTYLTEDNIEEIYEYVKEHKIIGLRYEW